MSLDPRSLLAFLQHVLAASTGPALATKRVPPRSLAFSIAWFSGSGAKYIRANSSTQQAH